jgi:hypothetical protein
MPNGGSSGGLVVNKRWDAEDVDSSADEEDQSEDWF